MRYYLWRIWPISVLLVLITHDAILILNGSIENKNEEYYEDEENEEEEYYKEVNTLIDKLSNEISNNHNNPIIFIQYLLVILSTLGFNSIKVF